MLLYLKNSKAIQDPEHSKVMLVVLLAPNNCIPTAMSIQSHAPDKLLILNSRMEKHKMELRGTPSQKMLKKWLNGSEDLVSMVSERARLDHPFPIPHTLPNGYLGDLDKENIEWKWCYNDQILDHINGTSRDWDGEVRIDILPGSGTGILIPTILEGLEKGISIWETLQDGRRIEFSRGMLDASPEFGLPLSIIDRCWLSGTPVHAEVHRQGHKGEGIPPNKVEFMRGISECFVVEDQNKFMSIITMEPEHSPKELVKNGYEYEILNYGTDANDRGTSVRISKGEMEMEITNVYRSQRQREFWGAADGTWAEEFVEASVWGGWEPASTARSLSIISGEGGRLQTFSLRMRISKGEWEKHGNKRSSGELWRGNCERHGFDPDDESSKVEQVVKLVLERLQTASEEERLEYLNIVRRAELDLVVLDSTGVTTFDSKVFIEEYGDDGIDWTASRFTAEGRRATESRRKSLGQSPDWLVRNSFFVICNSRPKGQSPLLPRRIHMQRMWEGREILLSSDMESPSSVPKGYAIVGEWNECVECGEKIFLDGEKMFRHRRSVDKKFRCDSCQNKTKSGRRRKEGKQPATEKLPEPGDTIVMLENKCGMSKREVAKIVRGDKTEWKLSNGKSIQKDQHLTVWKVEADKARDERATEKLPSPASIAQIPESFNIVSHLAKAISPYLRKPCKWIIVQAAISNLVPESVREAQFQTKEVRIQDWGPLLEEHIELYLVDGVWWVKKATAAD